MVYLSDVISAKECSSLVNALMGGAAYLCGGYFAFAQYASPCASISYAAQTALPGICVPVYVKQLSARNTSMGGMKTV